MSTTRLRRNDPEKERYWRTVVQGQQPSGQSVREYCRQAGVKESAFYSVLSKTFAPADTRNPGILDASTGFRISVTLDRL